MKTFKEFESRLGALLKDFGLGAGSVYSPVYSFMNEIKRDYIDQCVREANIYRVDYPSVDLSKAKSLDDLDEIKAAIEELFKDKTALKAKRLRELCPSVDAMGILRTGTQRNYWHSDVERDYTPEQVQQKLEGALMQKFKVTCYEDLEKWYNLGRAMRDLRDFLKLALNYDLVLIDSDEGLRTHLCSLPDIQIKLFKHSYHFKFTDKAMQKRLVDAYLEIKPVSNYFRNPNN